MGKFWHCVEKQWVSLVQGGYLSKKQRSKLRKKTKKRTCCMAAGPHRLSINPPRQDCRREGVCAGEPLGFPCAFNKGWIPDF